MNGVPQNVYVPLNFRLEFPKSDLTIYLPSGISEISCQMVSTPGLPVAYQQCCLHDDVMLNGVFPSEERRRPRFAMFINLSLVVRAQRGRNSNCDYFYRSLGCSQLHHPVVTSWCIFGLPCNATSSANAVVHYHGVYRKVRFTSAFYRQNLASPKMCTFAFTLHRCKPTINLFFLRRSM